MNSNTSPIKLVNYTSSLTKRGLEDFLVSVYQLALVRTIAELSTILSPKELEMVQSKLDKIITESERHEELLKLIKTAPSHGKTADKIFSEHFKGIEQTFSGFQKTFQKNFQAVVLELNEIIEV